jgi:predicted AlkP superfamily phosphohydrolase/phosphomutase|tara:strand:- start:1388 stop:1807 length:420 start_codon:yes stop_codon:yes gene_type:complete
MPTYEINVWRDKRVIEKVVREFESGEHVMDYIKNKWDNDKGLPRLDQEKGYLRPKTKDDIITWAKISTYIRKKGPRRIELTEEEKEIQGTLEKSITHEVIDEWGYNEMLRHTRKTYGPNPNAKGYNEFPGREDKTYYKK